MGQADGGVVVGLDILDGGRGYASDESPEILVAAPDGGGFPASRRSAMRVSTCTSRNVTLCTSPAPRLPVHVGS